MKKKAFKGFTLIELLGTILILGIIALITTLVITNIIKDTEKSSIALSVKSYIATVNDNIISAKLRNENIIDGTYKILADGNICLGTYSNSTCNGDILDLNIDRGKPISGEIVIEDKKVTTVLNANINGEIISYDAIKNKEIVSDTVAINDFTATRFTNSIKLSFSPVNATSFKCEYGLTENYGSEGVINSSKTECMINDLKPGTLYYYRLTISKEANNSDSKKGALMTLPLSVNPTIILNLSGYSTSKTATITYSSGLENARLINPKHYFYTTSAGTSNIEVANCGTDFEPGECDVLKTTSLKANTWYKLDSDDNITITYLINSTLIAKTVEDKTTVGSSQVLITTIDNNKPVIAVENIKYGEAANIELYDNQSGIKFFAVTSENTLPSITSDTAGTELNKWYQLESNTNQKITKEFTGLNVGVYYAWAKDELGNYESTRFVVEKTNDTITIASIEKTYDKNTFTPNITTTSGLTTTNTYYTDNKCTQAVQNAINAGDYYVIATTTGNGNYKSTTSGCVKAATINKATVAANTTCEASKIYDGNSNANCTIAITNTVGNDTINATGTCSYNNANVGSNKTITCNSLALTGANAVNYRLNDSTLTTTGNIYNAKLVFNPGDGVLDGTSPLYSRKGATSVYTEIANSTVGTIPIATRTNYTFTGWYTGDTKVINPDRSLVSDISNFTDSNGKWDLTSDQTLYAGWIASLYTITYNLDGGTVSQENPTTYTQSTPTFTLNNPTKAGYTFVGWSGTGLTGSSNTAVTINQGSTGNRSYTANWTLANYTIAYNLDGGTVTPENPTSYNTESSPITLNNPTKAGYTFAGWSGTDLTGNTNTAVTIPTGSTGDRSYTANWAPTNYTITYNLDGGSATNPATYNIETDTFTLNNPTKDGYTFKGWSGTSLSGDTNTTVTINKGSTGNRTYTANYTDNIAPTYSSAEIKNVTATGYDVYVYGVTDPSGVNRVQFPTWTDYNGQDDIQSSWTTSNAAKGTLQSNGTTWVYRVNITDHKNEAGLYYTHIYAYDALGNYNCIWTGSATVPTVTATFNGNGGGTPSPSSITKAYNNALGTLPTVSRTGYTHTGWFTASSGGTQISSNTVMPATAPTYYAQWSAINYTIGYDLKGGSATNSTSYTINSNAITLNNPTKSGFTFTGWSGTGLSGSANTSVTIPKGSTGNRSYTANWDKYNVTYNINRGQVSYVKSKNEYLDTGYIINWGRDFTITAKVSFSDTGRHQIIGNYYSTSVLKDFGLEFNADRKLRVWIDGAQRALSTGTVAANTDIDIVFTWNASTKQYTFTSTGTNSNASVSGTYNITGSSSYTLLMGTKDHRTGSATYSNITVKSASITTKYPAGSTLSDLPTPSNGTSENYIFHGWFPYSNGTGTKPTTSTAVNNDLTYYGYWTNEVLYMTEPTASKSLVTGTGNTKTTGYETGTVFTFTCNGSSGHYPTSLQIKYNGTAASTKSNSSSTTYVLSNTYTLTSYASSASVTATCTDNTGKTVNASATTRPAFRRFKLSYSGNGASLSGGDANNQYLLGDNTTQDGGHTVKLPTVSRGSAALGSNAYGLSTSSTTKSSSPTWGKTGPSVNIYYGTSTSTSSIVYASDNYSAVRTLYGVSNVKILNPTKTASAANGTNATSDASYIYVWNSSTSVTYVNQCSSSLPHLTCLPQAHSSGGAYDSAYKEICNGAGASCTASITNQYFIGGTSTTNCTWRCRATAGTG